jgi:polyisoprenoid-binding protein YceI
MIKPALSTIAQKTIILSFVLSMSSMVFAGALKTDASKSSVAFVFKQMEIPVQGQFKKFDAVIDYNSTKPENSKASVEIDLASLNLPAPEYNSEVLKKEWFNTAQFPKGSFVSTGMKAAAPGKLDVTGNLTIKGKTMPVRFAIIVKNEGPVLTFEGSFPIKRLAFNIGEGEWKDTSMLADEVLIKFKVVTTP